VTPAALGLQPHPEGGSYRETWRAPGTIVTPYGERSPATSILFLLQPGESSRWHRVRSGELWLWQGGGRLLLDLGGTADRPALASTVVVGPDPGDLQRLVQPHEWQAARPEAEQAVLVACVVSPGFDFADFELEAPDMADPR
jgi:predicted cupin superfamily sugar epimerase